jgi:hypothetical protein
VDSRQFAIGDAHVNLYPGFIEPARETLRDRRRKSEGFFGDEIDL